MFRKHSSLDLYTLQYRLFDHKLKKRRRYRTLSVSDSSLYEHCNHHVKQAYKIISPKSETRTMQTVRVMDRSHERMLSNEKNDMTERISRRNKRVVWADINELFLVCDGTKATLVDLK